MKPRLLLAAIGVALLMLLVLWLRPRATQVSVYFVRAEAQVSTLQAVSRTVTARGPQPALAAALGELLAGPTPQERAAGLTTAVPAGTQIRSVAIRDGIVVADFDRTVESGGGSSSMLARFWQIVYTATQFSDAARVQILIDGQEREAMGGEGVIIDHPVARPSTMPRF